MLSFLRSVFLGDEEFAYGPGLTDPALPGQLLSPDKILTYDANALNQFTQEHLNAMTKEQVDAYTKAVANATAVYDKAVADAAEIERRANLTFPVSLTEQEIAAMTPEARGDYYERQKYAPRPEWVEPVSQFGPAREGATEWQYDVQFMNGIGRLVNVTASSMSEVRQVQRTLALAGVASISRYQSHHPVLGVIRQPVIVNFMRPMRLLQLRRRGR